MYDYSLRSVQSRAAKAGDDLVTTSFPGTNTRGFAAVDALTVAVCLLPGTELAFESEVEWRRPFFGLFQNKQPCGRLARFRQVNLQHTETHHDAIEFPSGRTVLLNDLRPGQRAIVLQLPVVAVMGREDHATDGHGPIIDAEPVRTRQLDPI